LNPWQVAQLRYDEVIMIKNAKFRINKITGLDLTTNDLADVELVKLTRDYTPTPILYYDLVDCSNTSNVIHTNTDINYLIWAFDNLFVELVTSFDQFPDRTIKRFKVIKTQYNPDYQYENIWFNSQQIFIGTPLHSVTFDYKVFSDCNSQVSSNRLNVIDDYKPGYKGFQTCYTFYVTNTGETTNEFSYTSCDGTTTYQTLRPTEQVTICAKYGTLTGTGFEFTVQFGNCTP
jgi:hypothetical protein